MIWIRVKKKVLQVLQARRKGIYNSTILNDRDGMITVRMILHDNVAYYSSSWFAWDGIVSYVLKPPHQPFWQHGVFSQTADHLTSIPHDPNEQEQREIDLKISQLEASIRALKLRRNALSRISKLPYDTLTAIFMEVLLDSNPSQFTQHRDNNPRLPILATSRCELPFALVSNHCDWRVQDLPRARRAVKWSTDIHNCLRRGR